MRVLAESTMSVWGGACLSSQSLFPFLLPRATESMWFAEVDESSRLCRLESKLKQEVLHPIPPATRFADLHSRSTTFGICPHADPSA